ncbi:MAG: YebC/PmpR family DNA-binding transcriptional regulator [Candidatus Paceibacterota bacterium]|jgi:YebC/PmpR family DNA-binding regulatory protein
MSGHNKWSQIKNKKGVTDKKRSQVFSKLLRAISLAAKQNDNPQYNSKLKATMDKAKENNVPQENIERAIKKSQEVENIESLIIESYGPEGVALLIEASTDNRNRTISEIKRIISDHQGKWADPGSVMWAFEPDTNEHVWKAKFPQKISEDGERRLLSLMEALDDHGDVDEIYTNANLE